MPGGYDFNQIFSILCLLSRIIIVVQAGAQCRFRDRSIRLREFAEPANHAMLSGSTLVRKRI